jgi:poly(3-hydroxybutyrate) depolymerase
MAFGFLGFLSSCSDQAVPSGQPSGGAPSGGSVQNGSTAGSGGNASGGGASGSAGNLATGGDVSNQGGVTGGSAGSGSVTAAGAGSGGGAGTGGQAPNGGEVEVASAGCNKPTTIEPGTFAEATIGGRKTWIRLPPTYDEKRVYPLVFVWKGCSSAGVSMLGMPNVVGEDAILAQGDFPAGADCYDTGDGSAYTDIPVFDALLEHVEANYCVDKAHVFSVGFSSGAWLTQLLACQRGDVLRGIGTIAGAFKPAFTKGATCAGDGLAAFMVSDLDDHNNPFHDEDNDGDSVEAAVNHWLVANGCTDTTWTMQAGTPATPDESVCRAYAGCGDNPVELCLTSGKGHDIQPNLSLPGMWQMFQATLPK